MPIWLNCSTYERKWNVSIYIFPLMRMKTNNPKIEYWRNNIDILNLKSIIKIMYPKIKHAIVTGTSIMNKSLIYNKIPFGLWIKSDPMLLLFVGRSILFWKFVKISYGLVPSMGYMY